MRHAKSPRNETPQPQSIDQIGMKGEMMINAMTTM